MTVFIDFLLNGFQEGKAYSTVNTYRSAVSTTIKSISGRDIGEDHLVTRLMKGLFVSKPPVPRYSHTWDVAIVTSYLKTLIPLEFLSLKALCLKIVTLVALVSAQRSQTLQALRIDCMSVENSKVVFVIMDRLKTSRPGNNSVKVIIPEIKNDRAICPRSHLIEYVARTEKLRVNTQQLFVSYCKPHKGVSSSTLARWIKTVLEKFGIDTNIFKAHSTRSAATSEAFFSGASVKEILSSANWSKEKTFSKFYNRQVPESSLADMILIQ